MLTAIKAVFTSFRLGPGA